MHQVFSIFFIQKWFIDTIVESKEQIQPLLTTLEEFVQSPEFKRVANELVELADKTKKSKKENVTAEVW